MNNEQFIELNENFVKFLFEAVKEYECSFSEIVGIVMARMVSLAIHSNNHEEMLTLLPAMEKTLMETNTDGNLSRRFH